MAVFSSKCRLGCRGSLVFRRRALEWMAQLLPEVASPSSVRSDRAKPGAAGPGYSSAYVGGDASCRLAVVWESLDVPLAGLGEGWGEEEQG